MTITVIKFYQTQIHKRVYLLFGVRNPPPGVCCFRWNMLERWVAGVEVSLPPKFKTLLLLEFCSKGFAKTGEGYCMIDYEDPYRVHCPPLWRINCGKGSSIIKKKPHKNKSFFLPSVLIRTFFFFSKFQDSEFHFDAGHTCRILIHLKCKDFSS